MEQLLEPAIFTKDYPRFSFPGLNSPGCCFLRTQVKNNRLVFLCVQLIGYHGTSVTNAVSNIFSAAVKQLRSEGAIPNDPKIGLNEVARRSVLIEHYPPELGDPPQGSYAMIGFDTYLSPIWGFVSRQQAAQHSGVSEDFLTVDSALLRYAD